MRTTSSSSLTLVGGVVASAALLIATSALPAGTSPDQSAPGEAEQPGLVSSE